MFITDNFYVLTTTTLLLSGNKLFTYNLFHNSIAAIYNVDRDAREGRGSR